jgi:hypothetical protein
MRAFCIAANDGNVRTAVIGANRSEGRSPPEAEVVVIDRLSIQTLKSEPS